MAVDATIYLTVERATRELHQLLAAGKNGSPEADVLGATIDDLWESLSEAERLQIWDLSQDLYARHGGA